MLFIVSTPSSSSSKKYSQTRPSHPHQHPSHDYPYTDWRPIIHGPTSKEIKLLPATTHQQVQQSQPSSSFSSYSSFSSSAVGSSAVAGRPVARSLWVIKFIKILNSGVKDIRRSFTNENVFTRRSFTCMWKIFVQYSQHPVKIEARIHLLLHKIRWGFTLAKIKYVKDSSCSDFGDTKIRRRVDVECLATLEGGRFKIPVDGCIKGMKPRLLCAFSECRKIREAQQLKFEQIWTFHWRVMIFQSFDSILI